MKTPSEYLDHKPLHRSIAAETMDVDESTVVARLVPYGKTVELSDGVTECFERGAFAHHVSAPHRIKFRGVAGANQGGHMGEIVGHCTELRDEDAGPVGVFTIADTGAGRDTTTLLRTGTLDECSIEFVTTRQGFQVEKRGQALHVRHTKARLLAVAAVPAGAYGDDALVMEARSLQTVNRSAIIAHLQSLGS